MSERGQEGGALTPGERGASLSAALVLNGLALAILLMLRPTVPPTAGNASSGLVTVQTAAMPQVKIPPVVVRNLLKPIAVAVNTPAEMNDAEQEAAGEAASACPVLEDVAKSLIADPAALDAIIRTPPELRSIADAIVIWNATWAATAVTTPLGAKALLAPVRTNVEETLKTLPEACLTEVVTGPRLISIPNGDRSLILVFGSGDWSWQALLDQDETDQAQGMPAAATPQRGAADAFPSSGPSRITTSVTTRSAPSRPS